MKNISQISLINRGFVTRGTIINYVKDGKPIRHDFLEKLKTAYPLLDMNWLFTGEGDMELAEQIASDERIDKLEDVVDGLNEQMEEVLEELKAMNKRSLK